MLGRRIRSLADRAIDAAGRAADDGPMLARWREDERVDPWPYGLDRAGARQLLFHGLARYDRLFEINSSPPRAVPHTGLPTLADRVARHPTDHTDLLAGHGLSMTRVCALVVTRNRKRLLVECVRALAAQTHPVSSIIVYDNASTDGTEEWLRARGVLDLPLVRFERSEINTGGAGGYAEILRLGCETDAQWLWLMDDDAEPHGDALERLLASPVAADVGTAALCTAVVHRDGSVDPLHRCRLRQFVTPLPVAAYAPGTYAEVDCASFVGLLLRADAARSAGPPRREFFLGYDDAEYSLRLRRSGEIRLVPESVITHKIVIGGGEATRRSAIANRLLRARYTSSPWRSYWKDLYRLRNLVALRRQHGGLSRFGLGWLILVYAGKTLLYEQYPLRRLPWLVRFALKGWRGDFSAPSPEQWAAYAGGSLRD